MEVDNIILNLFYLPSAPWLEKSSKKETSYVYLPLFQPMNEKIRIKKARTKSRNRRWSGVPDG